MFNGIIFNQGTVKKILKRKKGINLFLKSNIGLRYQDLGISVSCDGACLTLTSIKNKLMEFYLSNETIKRSKFKNSMIGDKINKQKLEILKKNRISSIRLKLNSKNQFNLIELLNTIYQFGISSLLVEGGKILTENFLKKKLFNEFYLFQTSENLNKKGKIKISNIIKKLLITFKNKKYIDTYLDKDQLIYYY